MLISWLAVGAVITVLLSGNAIAGLLEDYVTAYEGKNYAAALQPCRSLAERGDARAQLSLGRHVLQRPRSAARLHPKGERDAQGGRTRLYPPRKPDLGVLYWNGQGVQQDVVLAYMWLSLAAAREPDAVGKRDVAASQMTPEEIAEAQRLARNWKLTPDP
jgi:hypothetical protein